MVNVSSLIGLSEVLDINISSPMIQLIILTPDLTTTFHPRILLVISVPYSKCTPFIRIEEVTLLLLIEQF